MTTLKNHSLLYDTNCPLCSAYTKGFIKTGMLDENGRLSYEEGLNTYGTYVDADRSRHEIALVDTTNGNVKYGIDSLVYIIVTKFPFLKPLLHNRVLQFLLKKLYAFISYNRKVIAPSPNYLSQSCVPDFNLSYRILYILFSAAITSTVLLYYSDSLKTVIPLTNLWREYAICFGQIAFQGGILLLMKTKKEFLFDYLGNMMTVSLLGGLLLMLLLIIRHFISFAPIAYLAYFAGVVLFMFLQHRKRVAWINAPAWLSYTWILYRCLVLFIIL
ncbi:MAG: hypothetical protein V4506_08720 [Bacteroidota bacterium]